jgi:hypothetical protein
MEGVSNYRRQVNLEFFFRRPVLPKNHEAKIVKLYLTSSLPLSKLERGKLSIAKQGVRPI